MPGDANSSPPTFHPSASFHLIQQSDLQGFLRVFRLIPAKKYDELQGLRVQLAILFMKALEDDTSSHFQRVG